MSSTCSATMCLRRRSFVFERTHLLGVADVHPADLRLSTVETLLADAVSPAQILRRRSGLVLLSTVMIYSSVNRFPFIELSFPKSMENSKHEG
jgi:hypothetical protein